MEAIHHLLGHFLTARNGNQLSLSLSLFGRWKVKLGVVQSSIIIEERMEIEWRCYRSSVVVEEHMMEIRMEMRIALRSWLRSAR